MVGAVGCGANPCGICPGPPIGGGGGAGAVAGVVGAAAGAPGAAVGGMAPVIGGGAPIACCGICGIGVCGCGRRTCISAAVIASRCAFCCGP